MTPMSTQENDLGLVKIVSQKQSVIYAPFKKQWLLLGLVSKPN